MQKGFRTTILTIGAIFLVSSLTLTAQTTPPPTRDGAAPAPQHHTKTGKTKKRSGKKAPRKNTRKKSASTKPK
jgi:hypothetical protein